MAEQHYGDEAPSAQALAELFTSPSKDLGLPGTSREKEMKTYYTLTGLAENLPNVESRNDVKRWLDSPALFKNFWDDFYKNELEPARDEAERLNTRLATGETIAEVNMAIRVGEANGKCKYSTRFPEKSSWNRMDHRAYLLYNITQVNMESRNGVFFQSQWSLDQCRNGIWQAIRYMIDTTGKERLRNKKKAAKISSSTDPTSSSDLPGFTDSPSNAMGDLDLSGTTPPPDITQPDSPSRQLEQTEREQAALANTSTPGQQEQHNVSGAGQSGRPQGYRAVTDAEVDKVKARLLIAQQQGNQERIKYWKNKLDQYYGIGVETEPPEKIVIGIKEVIKVEPTDSDQVRTGTGLPPARRETDVTSGQPEQSGDTDMSGTHDDDTHDRSRRSRNPSISPPRTPTRPSQSPTLQRDPTPPPRERTDWEIIIDELNDSPNPASFNSTLRYWQLVTIYGIVRPSHLPANISKIIFAAEREGEMTSDDIIAELNAMGIGWKDELARKLKDDKIITSGVATLVEQERFAQEEKFLNTDPDVEENLHKICEDLGIGVEDQPRIKGMPRHISLTRLQLVGIWRVWELSKSIKGGILADAMGLGKTGEYIGVILHAINERERQIASGVAVGRGKPKLVLVPPSLVGQTWNEIDKWTEGLNVMEYYDDVRGRGNTTGRPRVPGLLTKDHWIFHNDLTHKDDISKRVIVSSIPTWNQRHGPAGLKVWRRDALKMQKPQLEEREFVPDPNCPVLLEDMFDIVVVDEAHLLKQEDGHWQTAVLWLKPELFTLLVTATPGINSLQDWKGYLPFLVARDPPKDELGETYPAYTNPYVNGGIGDDEPLLRLQPDIFKHHITDNKDEIIAGAYVRRFQDVCVIRRTFATKINGQPVGANLPPIYKYYIDCHYDEEQQAVYEAMAEPHLAKLIMNLSKPGEARGEGRIVWNQKYARRLTLDSDWLGYEYCNEETLVENLAVLTGQPKWLWWLLHIVRANLGAAENQRVATAAAHGDDAPPKKEYVVPAVSDRPSLVNKICEDSPKYRACLGLIGDIVVRKREKAVIWTTYPAQQKVLEAMLQEVGINATALTSSLNTAEREALIDNFNTQPNGVQVLVLSYSMSSFGVNLHFLCRHSIHLNMPLSRAIRDQADSRFRRHGQNRDVYSWVISTADTFNDRHYMNNISKSTPQIVTELNKTEIYYAVRENSLGAIEVQIDGWVLVDGVLTKSNLVTPEISRDATVKKATIEHIVDYIQRSEKGTVLLFKD